MKLFEHPDFEQAVIRAAEHFRTQGLRESIIEKDYFVTEALRILEETAGKLIIFKGGTSLSKGWGLIERFSEDVDIFLDPAAFDPALGKKGIDRELKKLKEAIELHPGLAFLKNESQTIGGFGRNDRFEYAQRFAGIGDIRNRVFVEKMFAIHAKVDAFKRAGIPIGGYARHYYDLYCLAGTPEVQAMLASVEYAEIKADYDRISTEHFPKSYVPPPDMTFSKSDALFPPDSLAAALSAEYESQCRVLCFGTFPSWDDVQGRLDAVRALL